MNPTRELAVQTQKGVLALGDYMNVQAHACIGGKSIGEDIRKLDYGVYNIQAQQLRHPTARHPTCSTQQVSMSYRELLAVCST